MATGTLNPEHGTHALVDAFRRGTISVHPDLPPAELRFALACAGVGLDHHAGEQALVFANLDGSWRITTVVTDRRLCGRAESDVFDVRYAQMVRFMKKGLLDKHLVLYLQSGGAKVDVGELQYLVEPYLQQLLAVPAERREPPSKPLGPATEADPTGARQASEWLLSEAHVVRRLLAYVAAAYGRGELPLQVAQDLVARIALHHRNVELGRGMAQGRWLSPLGMNDLSHAMVSLFGDPMQHEEQPVRTLRLPSGLRSDYGKAAVSTALGLVSGAVLGIGWAETARMRVSSFDFVVADTGSHAAFRLRAPGSAQDLARDEPELVHRIDVALLEREQRILTRRVLFGWNPSTPELLSIPDSRLTACIEDVLGRPTDPAVGAG